MMLYEYLNHHYSAHNKNQILESSPYATSKNNNKECKLMLRRRLGEKIDIYSDRVFWNAFKDSKILKYYYNDSISSQQIADTILVLRFLEMWLSK